MNNQLPHTMRWVMSEECRTCGHILGDIICPDCGWGDMQATYAPCPTCAELTKKIEGLESNITILMGNRADLQAENVKLLEGLVTAVMERDTLRDTLDYTEEKVELLKAYKGNLEE